jgi:hypothetical protein
MSIRTRAFTKNYFNVFQKIALRSNMMILVFLLVWNVMGYNPLVTWNIIESANNFFPEKSSFGLFSIPWPSSENFNFGVAFGTSNASSDLNIFHFFSLTQPYSTLTSNSIGPSFPLASVEFLGILFSNVTPSRSTPFLTDESLGYRLKGALFLSSCLSSAFQIIRF